MRIPAVHRRARHFVSRCELVELLAYLECAVELAEAPSTELTPAELRELVGRWEEVYPGRRLGAAGAFLEAVACALEVDP